MRDTFDTFPEFTVDPTKFANAGHLFSQPWIDWVLVVELRRESWLQSLFRRLLRRSR